MKAGLRYCGVAQETDIDSYSIPARVCLGIAVSGGIVLIIVAVTSLYFMH